MKTKECTKCNEVKEISEFYKRNASYDGVAHLCKRCSQKKHIKYIRTKKGLISKIYGQQRKSSRERGHNYPSYSNNELKEWMLSQKLFHELYDEWKISGYDKMLIPSCDRIDDYRGYSLSNIQITTWQDNFDKGHYNIKNGINNKQNKAVISINPITGEKIKYHSAREAARIIDIFRENISACCNGRAKSAGGLYWRHV